MRLKQVLDTVGKPTPATELMQEQAMDTIRDAFTLSKQAERDLEIGPLSFDTAVHNQMYVG